MIKFITDIKHPDEPDILTPYKRKPLLIISLEGQLLQRFEPPLDGWTHDALCAVNESCSSSINDLGADAFLGKQWVGSTEV
ncbi:hypothetical protein OAA_13915 [Vibrio cyclitrophicus 1F175]|uniref:hypothetical protein n=1 Tax=Vibrio cyclitrophicus TaxID=47951 RepID=UPI0003634A70|nr:hypothetical protein [Vibrio cyclitrophicus]OEF63577.1 hypothetical protein OAA_13915 [Vibrio cyclitrophicus 1F175]